MKWRVFYDFECKVTRCDLDANKLPLVAVLRVVGARQEAAVSYRVAGPLGIQVKEGKVSEQGGAPGLATVWIGG